MECEWNELSYSHNNDRVIMIAACSRKYFNMLRRKKRSARDETMPRFGTRAKFDKAVKLRILASTALPVYVAQHKLCVVQCSSTQHKTTTVIDFKLSNSSSHADASEFIFDCLG